MDEVPSLKLTVKGPENQWLEDDSFPVWGPCLFFRGELAVSFREGNTYETDKTRTDYQQKRPTRVHPLNR